MSVVPPAPSVPVDAITQPWWDATRERRLLLQRCTTCRSVQHHPRALCISCGGTNLGWITAAGTGVVDTSTVIYRAAYGREVPYVVARVRLTEGPVVLTNILGEPGDSVIGASVTLDWAPLSDGRNLPVFRLAGTTRPQGS